MKSWRVTSPVVGAGYSLGSPGTWAVVAWALHDLGEIVHFADDAGLSRWVVVEPAWLDERITQILDSRAAAEARGVQR